MNRITRKTPDGLNWALPEYMMIPAINKLASYEDTGLTPEKVAAYAKAEAEGRLIVLPCKVGDTIYLPNEWMNVVVKFRIESIQIYQDNVMLIDDCLGEYEVSDFGKTVFTSREAAEAALEEVQHG